MSPQPQFTLYGAGSSAVMKVVLMLEELHLSYRFEHVKIFRGEQFSPAFQALNPNGRVPVLVDHGTNRTVFESGAILIYLAEEFGEFLPDKGEERYEVLQWLMLEVSGIGPTFGQHLHFTRFEPNVSDYARERYTSQAIRLMDVVEQRLQERKYLCDEQYSIADMAAFAWLGRLEVFKLPHEGRKNIVRWCKDIAARPATERMEQLARQIRDEATANRSQAGEDDMDRLFGRGEFLRRS
ncbi:glutathione S-transferase family protein [Pseudomonas sp. RIT-PI-q]|uniref:glutathione S-transferase family protein n=1 Tax=Pseudomonas sp. RIT-PI-q TaxID=1690247 RepID=UPI0007512CC3|nr:glutathione S-transferase N-terminal domain-containing protein [Pseudomonas sp. RIT-PI-q]